VYGFSSAFSDEGLTVPVSTFPQSHKVMWGKTMNDTA